MSEPDERTYMCCRCHHRWDGPLEGAALCGDCWRAFQNAGARVQALEMALKTARRAIDNYLSYSPSRRDEMALGALQTARSEVDAALTEPRREEERE